MKSGKKWIRSIAIFSAMILCVISLNSNTVNADIYSGGRPDGYITAYFSPSLASYGYSSYFTSGMCNWANITSQIWFSYSTSDNDSYDKYYVADTSTTGLFGTMAPYKKFLWFYIGAYFNDTWAYSTVTVYDNQMDNFSFTANQRISNITHEIGHTLSLDHPSTQQTAVMNQGQQSIGPQTYDRSELIRKWGP